jgi:hypothetical protein
MDDRGVLPRDPNLWPVYADLSEKLDGILHSEIICPRGSSNLVSTDGNLDGVVNERDVDDWDLFANFYGGGSSWYDIDNDGLTTESDLALITPFVGPPPTPCPPE